MSFASKGGCKDSEFINQRAAHGRVRAEKADPFIKRRLLDLAKSYDAELDPPARKPTLGRGAIAVASPAYIFWRSPHFRNRVFPPDTGTLSHRGKPG